MTPAPQLGFGLLLTAAAGFADAVGFILLGGYYTSFMSGNTTQLGAGLARMDWSVVLLTASLVLLFFIGSALGALLSIIAGNRWGAVVATLLVLATFAATLILHLSGFGTAQVMLMLAAGAGAQNVILPSTGSVRLGTTFVTGTLFAAGLDLARGLRSLAPKWRWIQHLLVWASLMGGASLGTLAYAAWGIGSLGLPMAIYAVFAIVFLVRRPDALSL